MRRVIMRHVPESGNLRLQIQAGDVDVGQYLATGDLEALAKDKVTIDATPGFGYYYIALNMKDPDLQKPLVRRAFQHMLDWKALAQTTMRFNGFPWQSTIPKGMAGAPADPTPDYRLRSRAGQEAAGRGRLSQRPEEEALPRRPRPPAEHRGAAGQRQGGRRRARSWCPASTRPTSAPGTSRC